MVYNRRTRPRRGRRNLRRGRFNKRKALGYRKKVAGMVHVVKRLGQPMFIQNTTAAGGGPELTNSGAGSMFMTSPIAGQLPGTWQAGISAQFQLSSCLDYTDLTSLFDRYKICGVALKIQYLHNASFIPGNNANLPTLHYAFDGDDANTPGTALLVLAKGYCKTRTLNANRPLSVYIKPRLTKEVYNTPFSGYTSEKACFLDCNSDTVPHFGLKMWLSDWVGGVENNNAIRIQPVYYLKLRDTQ